MQLRKQDFYFLKIKTKTKILFFCLGDFSLEDYITGFS